MKRTIISITYTTSLIFLIMLVSTSAAASSGDSAPSPEIACDSVDIYFYNALDVQIFADATNWSTGAVWWGYIDAQEGVQISLPAGNFEFWVTDFGFPIMWDAGAWQPLPGCSRAALTVKPGLLEPKLIIKTFPPGIK